ncbi:MAG TPA: alpha/beta fold hydrolase [Rhodanobacteraceae bacterium]
MQKSCAWNIWATIGLLGATFAASAVAATAPSTQVAAEAHGIRVQPLSVPSPFGPLRGALAVPAGNGPFPAVVFAAGSGPNDMDETIGPNTPFRDLAVGLAKAGIASLRFDKRAHEYGLRMAGKPITVDDEETNDVLSALRVLAKQPHVAADRLFVVGHSEGAMLAPRIAKKSGRLAGIVMLAAPARPMLALLAEQIRYLGKLQDVPAAQIEAQEQAIAAERTLLANADPTHPPTGVFFHAPQSFWLSLHDYDQVAVAKSLALPMLILQGSNDYQVSPTLDFGVWKKALAKKSNVTFHLFPGLSHLFMPGPTRSPADYAKPAHVDPAVIQAIADWIKAKPAK